MITCSTPHRPWSNGVCINGVVYYIAKTGASMLQLSLMRFGLRSEKLDLLTSLPPQIRTPGLYCETLITYQGKVAIPINHTSYITDVWVIDQDAEKHEWLKKITFSTQKYLRNTYRYFRVIGTTHTGDFILAPSSYSDEVYVFHYNPGTNHFRKVNFRITKLKPHCHIRAIVFSDYVESVRLLSNRQLII